jgi:hypothetical protein
MIGDSAGSLRAFYPDQLTSRGHLTCVRCFSTIGGHAARRGERANIIVVDNLGGRSTPIVYGTNLHEHTTKRSKRWIAAWRAGSSGTASRHCIDTSWTTLAHCPDDADQSGPKAALCVPATQQMVER